MKSIIITGSTRGIGNALAFAFLDRGCKVMINGRNTLCPGCAFCKVPV